MSDSDPKDMDDFTEALSQIRDLRKWGVKDSVSPWVIRQALIVTIEMDTITALRRGVKQADLDAFDQQARIQARAFIEKVPE